jgi:hypothetical protein
VAHAASSAIIPDGFAKTTIKISRGLDRMPALVAALERPAPSATSRMTVKCRGYRKGFGQNRKAAYLSDV